ncbi:MAG: zinc ribbon domain-containing protein [Bacilli bacterium]|nr:zinc ribbon domain-containing protein [Bacilli bacterium]
MFCRSCGKELSEGAKFCDACGAKVEEEKVVVVQEQAALKDESCKVGLGCAIASFVLMVVSLPFAFIPIVGWVLYIILMILSYCFAVPAFIVSLIRIIQRKRLGAAITAMSFTIISVIMDISFIGVVAGILESLA